MSQPINHLSLKKQYRISFACLLLTRGFLFLPDSLSLFFRFPKIVIGMFTIMILP